MIKISRRILLAVTASLGVLIILYALVRHYTGIGLGEQAERYFMDIVIFAALGLFMYNRKLAADEKRAKEAAERESRNPPEETAADAPLSGEDLPHWERKEEGD
ncbi:MAG: hypothetical protein LBD31_08290 [Treponema sp.]|jgi:uncharacterized membrane protein|nr:hypothetical protein [Treponema sp.]